MTSPSDPSIRVAPTAPAAPDTTAEVVETAKKLVRARSFAKKTFEKVGVPALIGSASALVTTVVITRRGQDDNDDDVSFDVSDTNTE